MSGLMLSRMIYLLLLLAIIGCSAPSPAGIPAAKQKRELGEPITAGEFYDVAVEIESAAAAKDADLMDKWVDYPAIIKRAHKNLKTGELDAETELENDLDSVPNGFFCLGKTVVPNIERGGFFQLLRVNRRQNVCFAMYRVQRAEDLDYLELRFRKDASGTIAVDEVFHWILSETLSATIRRAAKERIADWHRRHGPNWTVKLDAFDELATGAIIEEHLRSGNHRAVLDVIATVPAFKQKERYYLLLRMIAAAQAGELAESRKALDTLKATYPSDITLDIASQPLLLKEKNYAAVYKSIDDLDEFVGGDPYLNAIRSVVLLEEGKADEALAVAKLAIQAPAVARQAYWQVISILLKQQDFVAVCDYLAEYEERFQLQIVDIETNPDYAEFVKSPEYEMWLKREKDDSPVF
ncbi:hypothetical protein [Anatilimnocola floriformis]|uniref:hypothetical protein n=1 Tax=Anatilimnocola floriformis TaxID=2948575 RepID=UPI0020C28448|nr:hypothetical protein [Anatilimnocola floriformis]